MKVQAKIKGSARARVLRRGKEVFSSHLTDNVLLGNFFSGFKYMKYVLVGTGTTEPQTTDSGLENSIASSQITTIAASRTIDGSSFIYKKTMTAVFNIGSVVGNISEAGLSESSNNTQCLSRVLFKDDLGNPVVIPVTAEDQLIVEYELQTSLPWHTTEVIDVDGVQTTFDVFITSRLYPQTSTSYNANVPSRYFNLNYQYGAIYSEQSALACVYPQDINTLGSGALTGNNSDFKSNLFSPTTEYDAVGRKISEVYSASMSGADVFQDNTVEGIIISSLTSNSSSAYQFPYGIIHVKATPPIPKTSSYALNLGVKLELIG
ncbi:hypothetical protein [Shewanella algae]|uniref:hypothetical protein n=1 Tax=Shewanella algae TaxID=38313 RepID=UPI0038B3B815